MRIRFILTNVIVKSEKGGKTNLISGGKQKEIRLGRGEQVEIDW